MAHIITRYISELSFAVVAVEDREADGEVGVDVDGVDDEVEEGLNNPLVSANDAIKKPISPRAVTVREEGGKL
jgi:hypothetical protein